MASGNKQNMQHSLNGGIQFVNETESIIRGQGDYGGLKRSREDAGIDNTDSDNEGDSRGFGPNEFGITYTKSGKKTRGRVKIDMKYIDNKLRRYTTFSKRKTGIMKKAYELSTLTGTQVMLLVASETGHVYTFATRKLQPMITSDTGKALIQTCLNSPDVGQSSPGQMPPADQRMNPSGYEETEITYSQEDELSQRVTPPDHMNIKQESAYASRAASNSSPTATSYVIPQSQSVNGDNPTVHLITPEAPSPPQPRTAQYMQTQQLSPAATPQSQTSGSTSKQGTVTMQLPTASYVLPQSAITAPFAVQPSTTGQALTNQITTNQTLNQPQALLQQAGNPSTESVPQTLLVSTPGQQPPPQGITFLQAPGGMSSVNSSQATLVYQTLQGMFASNQQIANLPEGFVLGVPQSSALTLPQSETNTGGGTPQYITIPVPVSLAGNTGHTQMFAIPVSQSGSTSANMKKS